MWPLAIVAGIAVSIVARFLAVRCSRAGWVALSRVLDFLKWPALFFSTGAALGAGRHATAGTLAWQALVVFAGALTGLAATQAVYATLRFFRTARRGDNPAP